MSEAPESISCNPVALRLHECRLILEGTGNPELVSILVIAEREIERLHEINFGSKAEVGRLKQELESLITASSSAANTLMQSSNELFRLGSEVDRLTQENAALKSRRSGCACQIDDATQTIAKMCNHHAQEIERVRALEIERLQNPSWLAVENSALRASLKRLRDDQAVSSESIFSLATEVERLQKALDEAQRDNARILSSDIPKRVELDRLNRREQELMKENERLKKRNEIASDYMSRDIRYQYLERIAEIEAQPTKGQYGGVCNRTACHKRPATWKNHGVPNRFYCELCAKLINENNRGIEPPLCSPADGHEDIEAQAGRVE